MSEPKRTREWWIDINEWLDDPECWSGHAFSPKWLEEMEMSGDGMIHVIEKSAFDELAKRCERAEEGERFYRSEWTSACERYDYQKEENERLKSEIEQMMRVDYWAEKYQELKKLYDSHRQMHKLPWCGDDKK